ncbi:hypothetical protein [Lacrimispora sp.]|uniref:hypothetical protein n=1 Tax=Lacrimispora sp. TaxID=2719234 RepID=UPI0028B19D00|nr:hypothetical protein [Lacrimispora sp.]
MNKSKLTYEDFKTYLPDYNFEDKQLMFFEETFETIIHNKDTSKVTCIADRPGIGKSTFIKSFMHCCIGDFFYCGRHEPQGLVVVTDSIKRLEELSNGEKDRKNAEKYWGEVFESFGFSNHYKNFENSVIVLRSDTPFMEQLIKQHYKPIVLLSTQRYFMLSESIREQLFSFSYKKQPLKRDIVIFDECPYFSETININSVNLTRIESALYEGLSNEVENKDYVIKEFKTFKDRLLDQMDNKENLSEDLNVILYWKDERYSTITPNDTLFFKVITENMEPLSKQYNAILKDLMCLQKIAKDGAIFHSIKKKHGNYERSLVMVIDNRDYFYLNQDKKFFVFDATADIDPRYDLDYVEIVDGKKYNIPLNMTITNVKMSTSKNALCNGKKSSFNTTNAIIEYIRNKLKHYIGRPKDILIVLYSDLIKRFKDFKYIGYFGNLRGFNDFKDLYNMAYIGMNRFPNMAYFYMYCGSHMEIYQRLSEMTEQESMDFFDGISKNHNKEYQYIITQTMLRCILADFEQNIFRLAIRNYKNTEKVQIWTFYNVDDDLYGELSSMIEDRYKAVGTNFEYEDTPLSLKIDKVKDRKPPDGKKMTNAQKIVNWCDSQTTGKLFKLNELLSDTGLNNDSFKDTKKSNQTVRLLFEQMQTDKKGYYRIS